MFSFTPEPVGFMDMGNAFPKVIDPNSGSSVIAVDTYFVPSVDVFNNSYVEITYPEEIKLPTRLVSFQNASDIEKKLNLSKIDCDVI